MLVCVYGYSLFSYGLRDFMVVLQKFLFIPSEAGGLFADKLAELYRASQMILACSVLTTP